MMMMNSDVLWWWRGQDVGREAELHPFTQVLEINLFHND